VMDVLRAPNAVYARLSEVMETNDLTAALLQGIQHMKLPVA
jgi:hypothetical protein